MIVIAHRGASGYRPEHTLAAYELGARLGADFIEPDLVSTADGVLVARHEHEISATTDVAARAEFAARRRDGGWFAEDFTLAELKTLRARERIPHLRPANARYDGRFEIPTFAEVLDLAHRLTEELGRPVGVYPETKHPEHFRSIGLPLEPPLVEALRGADVPLFVQSFGDNLPALRDRLDVPLVQLLGRPDGTRVDFGAIAAYADAVGPAKEHLRADPAFVASAHAAGLAVHPYTFRSENAFLPEDLRSSADPAAHGDAAAEYLRYIEMGIDGLFSDFPDAAVAAVTGTSC